MLVLPPPFHAFAASVLADDHARIFKGNHTGGRRPWTEAVDGGRGQRPQFCSVEGKSMLYNTCPRYITCT